MTDRDAFRIRFGREAPDGLDIGGIGTHRSVRDFVPHALPEGTVEALQLAAASASTSSNLQAWSVVATTDPEGKARLAALCSDQRQIKECGLFLAFFADLHRVSLAAPDAAILDTAEMGLVATIDAALAAERLVVAAERLGLGICYIGALRDHPADVRELLGLPDRVVGVFGLCVGVPADPSAGGPRPKLAPEAFWFADRYDPAPDIAEYDRRHAAYAAKEGMGGPPEWSPRTARRVGEKALGSRAGLLEFLRSVGLFRR